MKNLKTRREGDKDPTGKTARKRINELANTVDIHAGAYIRAQRLDMGLTQQQLAEKVGISYQQIQKYETGANRISAGRLWVLSQALETDIASFFQPLIGVEAKEEPDRRARSILQQTSLLNGEVQAALTHLIAALSKTKG